MTIADLELFNFQSHKLFTFVIPLKISLNVNTCSAKEKSQSQGKTDGF